MKIAKYLHVPWLSVLLKILLFIFLLIATNERNKESYFVFIDLFAFLGFSLLSYTSSKQGKIISACLFCFCAFLFYVGNNGYTRNQWILLDGVSCAIIVLCTIYEMTIKIMKEDHEKSTKDLHEKLIVYEEILKNKSKFI